METDRKIAVFMSDSEFDEYQNRNKIITGLVEKVEDLENYKKNFIDYKDLGIKITICSRSEKDYLDKGGIYFKRDIASLVDNNQLAEQVVEILNKEDSLLKSLAIEIQYLNDYNDKLQDRLYSIPTWIKWIFR